MNNSVVFYLPPDSLNEATIYYTDLIRRAFIDLGFSIKDSDQVTNIGDPSCIVCIRPGDVLKALQKSSPSKIVSWFQGIGPEEYKVLHPGIRGCIGKYYLNFSEKKALRKSDLCIMVSDSMLKHYEQKYNIHLAHKTVIVPCYNKPIDSQAFLVEDRYNRPKFVYAGALYEWQCIRETLMIFKEIENKNPAAELTILTGQREQAEKLVEEFKLKNVEIDFEPLSTLQDRLQKYKYGFLLRRDNVVNNVATPTKMNSYLAAGLVPIYTDVIDAFEKYIDLKEFTLKTNLEAKSIESIVQQILEFDKREIDSKAFFTVTERIFSHYYDDLQNLKIIKMHFKKLLSIESATV